MGKSWTGEELAYVTEKDNQGQYVRTIDQCAADLGRTYSSIAQKRSPAAMSYKERHPEKYSREYRAKYKYDQRQKQGKRLAVLEQTTWTPAEQEIIRACMVGTATRDQWMHHPHLSGPNSYSGQVQRMALDKLLDHRATGQLPTSNRFILYELEQDGKIAKPVKGEKRYAKKGEKPREQNLTNALRDLRSWDIVPWEWIVDETRHLDKWRQADTVLDHVKDSIKYARINPWPDEPPLLLCESRSLSGVLASVAAEFVCPIASTNGQAAGFLRTKIAPILIDNDREVLYLGDHDLVGNDIEANNRWVLEDETEREIEWTRIALTDQQIEDNGLQDLWIEKEDHRWEPPRKSKAWETEALGQGLIVDLVRKALTKRLLPVTLADVRERERTQREAVRELLADLDDPAWDEE